MQLSKANVEVLTANIEYIATLPIAARTLAHMLHAGQRRAGGEPFITHPEMVVRNFSRWLGGASRPGMASRSPECVCVATQALTVCWLHDVLEDCPITACTLRARLLDEWLLLRRPSDTPLSAWQTYTSRCLVDVVEELSGEFSGKCVSTLAVLVKSFDIEANLATCAALPEARRMRWLSEKIEQLTAMRAASPERMGELFADLELPASYRFTTLIDELLTRAEALRGEA